MKQRQKLIIITFLVGMALFVNLAFGGMSKDNMLFEEEDNYIKAEESLYDDYVVIKSTDGSLLLIPKEDVKDVDVDEFSDQVPKSDDSPFISEKEDSDEVDNFESSEELRRYLENHTSKRTYSHWGGGLIRTPTMGMVNTFNSGTAKNDNGVSYEFSTTNNQVSGVDEGDIVKTDGKYVYLVSKDRSEVHIIDARSPEKASIVSSIDTKGSIREIYIKEDTMVVIGFRMVYQLDPTPICNDTRYYTMNGNNEVVELEMGKFYYFNYIYYQATFIEIYNVEEREEPELKESHLVRGNLLQSRMIGNHVYVITTQYLYSNFNDYELGVPASEIFYLDSKVDSSTVNYYMQLTSIISIDITEPSEFSDYRVILMKASGLIYVSTNNIYITYYEYDYEKKTTSTVIHRISIDEGEILYKANGKIDGTLINRFSMDEHNGYFRVASSIGWRGSHRVTVLNMDLDVVGCVKDIAPGEQMFSARFMGNRAYLVTFQIRWGDPFFVIDLTDPANPEILGELHIPGWSDYLHPYDENHVIGLGREAVLNGPREGIKLSLFDVTDVENPKEVSKVVIGTIASSSTAAFDPHAFLFDYEKNLLVIPVKLNYSTPANAYVYKITLEDGFELQGIVSHPVEEDETKPYYWYYNYFSDIRRSFYINDVLFTLSNNYLQMNDLDDLEQINVIELPDEPESERYIPFMCLYIEPFVVR